MNPIFINNRNHIAAPSESSALLPARDSSSPNHNWKKIASSVERALNESNISGQINRALAAIPPIQDQSYGFFPFMIYRVPDFFRSITQPNFDMDNNWKTFRVRVGYARVEGKQTNGDEWIFVTQNTDNIDGEPEDDVLFNSSFVEPSKDFVAEENSYTYVWLDISDYVGGGAMTVKASDDPANNGWPEFPNKNPFVHLIGTVFADPFSGEFYIQQISSSNHNFDDRMQHFGAWQANSFNGVGYPKGAVVYLGYDNTQAPSQGLADKALCPTSSSTNVGFFSSSTYVSAKWGNKSNPGTHNELVNSGSVDWYRIGFSRYALC